MDLDREVLGLLMESSSGMTFTEIKKAMGFRVNDAILYTCLKRLQKHRDIRKVLYCDFSKKPTYYYIPFESETFTITSEKGKAQYIFTCLRTEVLLEDHTSAYYYVYLNYFGEEIDHDLEKVQGAHQHTSAAL